MKVEKIVSIKRFSVRRLITVRDRLNVIYAYFGSLTVFTHKQNTYARVASALHMNPSTVAATV